LIRQARLFSEGFEITEASAALSDIDSIGPGGNFLMSDLTFELCRKVNFGSSIWPNLSLDQWQAEGSPKADELLRMRTREILNDLAAPEDHADIIARGEAFIRMKLT
jgi:trimethylamine:corrinoid methyltransferase-like protein